MGLQRTIAEVSQITPLTDSILRVMLKPKAFISYLAGQYLQVHLDEEAFSFSIANAPLGSHQCELHMRHCRDNPHHQKLLDAIRTQGQLEISLPLGSCSIQELDATKPILFIAGGTGFAPVHAMIEQLLANNDPRRFELHWGVRTLSDLYLHEQVLQWEHHVSNFKYHYLVSDQSEDTLVSQVLNKHQKDLLKWQIVLSGPFDMVYAIRDMLAGQGVSRGAMFSDAFSFEQL